MTTPSEYAVIPAILAELDRLDGHQHAPKKKATILALVAARVSGRSEETVWGLSEVCNRSTYHQKWKRDATFADVLKRVTAAAFQHKNTEAARAVTKAAERLALASPAAAARLAGLLQSTDESTVRLAAINILDRAGLETAAKAQQQQVVSAAADWRQDAERRRREVELMLTEMDEDAGERGV